MGILLLANVTFAGELENSLKPHLGKLYDQLTAQSATAVESCHAMETVLAEKKARADIETAFNQLIFDWKRVQSLYVISEYDDDAIDIPHFIDVYHRGNEDLGEQMQRALKSTDDAKTTLFKHSFKTINALEYVLYDKKEGLTERQRQLSAVITQNICNRLASINDFYSKHKADFLKKPKKAVAIVLNELVDNSYKLKEWRLGDAAGVSRKNVGKPNAKFIEYRLSEQSISAAKAIMESHERLTKPDSELTKIITLLAKFDEIEEPLEALDNARIHTAETIKVLQSLNHADLTNPDKIKPAYKALNALNDSYLIELIDSLSDVVARILDSDGD